jgi:hypothetical protein
LFLVDVSLLLDGDIFFFLKTSIYTFTHAWLFWWSIYFFVLMMIQRRSFERINEIKTNSIMFIWESFIEFENENLLIFLPYSFFFVLMMIQRRSFDRINEIKTNSIMFIWEPLSNFMNILCLIIIISHSLFFYLAHFSFLFFVLMMIQRRSFEIESMR